MLHQLSLENVLCLDIETVSQKSGYELMDDTERKLWERKASNLKKEEGEDAAALYKRAGIYAEFGKIICISTGFLSFKDGKRQFRLKSFYGDSEAILLREFADLLRQIAGRKSDMLLCAHNGKEFDFPYICRRMVINGIALPPQLDMFGKKPWEIPHLDTMELWKFGDFKSYTPLNLLAHIMGIPSPKDDIDGSQVGQVYWEEKNLERIVTYCQKDVVTVMQILLRFKGEDLLDPSELLVP